MVTKRSRPRRDEQTPVQPLDEQTPVQQAEGLYVTVEKSSGNKILSVLGIGGVVVVILIILAAVLYVWAASFLEQGESSPIAHFTSWKDENGAYYVTVQMVSTMHELEAFSYFLKDASGDTNEFGEIAMQSFSGTRVGIDITYDEKCGENCDADLMEHSSAVEDDDGSSYAVAFMDQERDGILSPGDEFKVHGSHGSSSDGPANDNWSLEVKFDNTGDIIGSIRLG